MGFCSLEVWSGSPEWGGRVCTSTVAPGEVEKECLQSNVYAVIIYEKHSLLPLLTTYTLCYSW